MVILHDTLRLPAFPAFDVAFTRLQITRLRTRTFAVSLWRIPSYADFTHAVTFGLRTRARAVARFAHLLVARTHARSRFTVSSSHAHSYPVGLHGSTHVSLRWFDVCLRADRLLYPVYTFLIPTVAVLYFAVAVVGCARCG